MKVKLRSQEFVTRVLVVILAIVPAAGAQMARSGGQQASAQSTGVDSLQTQLHSLTDVQRQNPGMDPKEFADYKRFYNENSEPRKKIELGKVFLEKYPKSALVEAVDAELVSAYIDAQDWSNVYSTADSALALKPDDVDVLTTVGWVIPHVYHVDDPNADSLLSKAETYEKHAIEVLATMSKPASVSDAQFAALKERKSLQAHSALGLVYFRRDDFDASAKELEQVTQGNPNPDEADLFVLGIDLQNLKRYADAAEAFNRCAQISGGLVDRCKQGAEGASKLAQSK